jgi:hypothetical protein
MTTLIINGEQQNLTFIDENTDIDALLAAHTSSNEADDMNKLYEATVDRVFFKNTGRTLEQADDRNKTHQRWMSYALACARNAINNR